MTEPDRISTYDHDGLTFDVTDRGPLDGEVVVCLHGFPQSSRSWGPVGDRLVDAGLRVLAPDQRGYSPGARPPRRRDYSADRLAADVVALIDAVGRDRVHVVGHDWGGFVAWQLGADHADRVATLTAVSTPHPRAMQQSFIRSTQGLHSWYMAAFQLPWLPEKIVGSKGGDRVREGLVKAGLTEASAADSARLLADPSAARAMVNWYRAVPFSARRPVGKVDVPTVYVWSDRDAYLGRWAAEHTAAWVTGPYRLVEIAGGSHWIPEEHPDRLADAIRAITSEFPAPRGIAH
jgi:pimeloyl-ACP methyl ester carboxylesterase